MEVSYYINNKEVRRPLNYPELAIELNYDKDIATQAVSTNEWEWGLGNSLDSMDGAKTIQDFITNNGVFIGCPFRVDLFDGGVTNVVFDGYLDLSTAIFDCDRVITQAVERKGVDWLNDVADSVSFEYLYEIGKITNSDFVSVPYVVSEIPNTREALLGIISMAVIAFELGDQINNIIKLFTGSANPLQFADVIKLVFQIIYTVGLILTLIELFKQVKNLLIQPIKYHDGMFVKDLLTKGAEHFGYTFKSTIFDNSPYDKLMIIPEKYSHDVNTTSSVFSLITDPRGSGSSASKNVSSETLGYLNPNNPNAKGVFKGTVGELLKAMKVMFNGKIIIEGNDLRLERRDYYTGGANYKISQIDDTDYQLNFDELKSNYLIEFQKDFNEKNTLLNYEGTSIQIITSSNASTSTSINLSKGLEINTIPFARGFRKEELTIVEKIVKFFAELIDVIGNAIISVVAAIVKAINDIIDTINSVIAVLKTLKVLKKDFPGIPTIPVPKWTDLSDQIDDRIGMLLLENDFIDVAKIILINNNTNNPRKTEVRTDNLIYVDAEYLWDNYHFIDSFVKTASRPNANQYKIYSIEKDVFCYDDFVKVKNSNFIQNSEGQDGEIISIRWNVEDQVAEIKYKINELYDQYLKQQKIIPDGK